MYILTQLNSSKAKIGMVLDMSKSITLTVHHHLNSKPRINKKCSVKLFFSIRIKELLGASVQALTIHLVDLVVSTTYK